MKTIIAPISLLILASLLSSTSTASITTFNGTFENGSSRLEWGDPGDFGVGPSWISYMAYPISTELILTGEKFHIGQLQYFNGTILMGTGISEGILEFFGESDDPALNIVQFGAKFFTESTPNISTPEKNADYLFFWRSIPQIEFPGFFYVYEGDSARADIVAQYVMLEEADLAVSNESTGGSSPKYRLEIVGFANPQGDGGFLRDEPFAAVPEPSSILVWGLLATVGLGIGWRRKK